MIAPRIARLRLSEFRSFAALDCEFGPMLVALCGENGVGKTNLLEALSLLTTGRGLRRASLAEMARLGGPGNFAVVANLDGPDGETMLATGSERDPGSLNPVRRSRINGAPVSSSNAFSEHLRIVWMTPALDGLFNGPPGDRRRFVDRLVLAIDPGHAARAAALEQALRSRNRLLDEQRPDAAWLDAVERQIAELGIAVAFARRETIERLAALIAARRDDNSLFPFAELALMGETDALIVAHSAIEAEDRMRQSLRDTRARDRAAGRTLTGPQTSDLAVRHGPKGIDAARASTGEQKALLIGLVMAHAHLVAQMSGIAPLVLLDEVAAHLDPGRREALFVALAKLGGQVWMTGADRALFGDLPAGAKLFQVTPGEVAAEAS
ncbi:DNA replication and repair protein RecF [Rhizobiales bacterium GAS191]|nr:DNA replication and repair protein RecF [Rhizobiales bacterium GAS191]